MTRILFNPILRLLCPVFLMLLLGACSKDAPIEQPSPEEAPTKFNFVSFPDFFNFDIPYPWQPYDTAVNYFLERVKAENPEFVLVAGDLVGGRWWNSRELVGQLGAVYYEDWKARMEAHDLTYYTAIGDHELGDDPWDDPKRQALAPHFEQVYQQHMNMPENGPNGKGSAYYVKKGNTLLVTVKTFAFKNNAVEAGLSEKQLAWLKQVLKANRDAKFIIVQGHVPVWGNLPGRSTSGLMLKKGKQSPFFKIMKKYGVDLYLCGEFHAVDARKSEGIWQIVHGSSWGREQVNTQHYLTARVRKQNLHLKMKRIYMDARGDYMWNMNKAPGPRERMAINQSTLDAGPETVGTLTIHKANDQKQYRNRTGIFVE